MKNALIAILLAAIVATTSCSRTQEPQHGQLPDKPGENENPEKPYDFTPELSDKETRFTSKNLSLFYKNGGLIAMHDTESGKLSLIDLATGHSVCLTTRNLATGVIDAILEIDGKMVDTKEIRIEHSTADGVWISILDTNGNRSVLVFNISN